MAKNYKYHLCNNVLDRYVPALDGTSGYGQTDARSVFDPFFDPTRWILLVSIVVIGITAIVAIITKKDGLSKLSGIFGIIASIISLGTILLVCLGSSMIGSATSSYGVQSGLGIGFYVSLIILPKIGRASCRERV